MQAPDRPNPGRTALKSLAVLGIIGGAIGGEPIFSKWILGNRPELYRFIESARDKIEQECGDVTGIRRESPFVSAPDLEQRIATYEESDDGMETYTLPVEIDSARQPCIESVARTLVRDGKKQGIGFEYGPDYRARSAFNFGVPEPTLPVLLTARTPLPQRNSGPR